MQYGNQITHTLSTYIFHKSGYSLPAFLCIFSEWKQKQWYSTSVWMHVHTHLWLCTCCMVMHMDSLECKYASVQLLLNRKSSSRMIESQSVLSVYSTNMHTHKCTHTYIHLHTHIHSTHRGTQSRGLIFSLCKVSQVHRNINHFFDFSYRQVVFACSISRCVMTIRSFWLARMFLMYLMCDTKQKQKLSQEKLSDG